jgi:hypothetical protein
MSIFFVVFGFCWSQQLEFQYTNQQLNAYNDLTSDTPIFTQNFDDQVSSAIPIVPFTIGGQAYNTLFVSTNGFVTLGQAASTTNYNPISQPQGMPVIAPFAGNLESANNSARISYTILNGFGNVPYSIIIQWKNVRQLILFTVIFPRLIAPKLQLKWVFVLEMEMHLPIFKISKSIMAIPGCRSSLVTMLIQRVYFHLQTDPQVYHLQE